MTVIDGQQRLTTLTLLLTALRDRLVEIGDQEDVTKAEIEDEYLFNKHAKGDDRYKLILTQTDRGTLISLLEQVEPPVHQSVRLLENYRFFKEQLSSGAVDVNRVFEGVTKLLVVDVALDPKEDDPQLIFESLNSTGLALTQADLIRNFVLMGTSPNEQENLYTHYWRRMEERFGQANYVKQFDAFMRHFLTLRLGRIPRIDEVYAEFKAYVQSSCLPISDVVADIHEHAEYYVRIALGQESDDELKRAFVDLTALEVNVAIPFLLEVYEDYQAGVLQRDDFVQILRAIESYIIRRVICDLPTNALNKIFLTFAKALDKARYVESVEARFRMLSGTGRFPNNEEFKRDFVVRDIYNLSKRRNYLLTKLTNQGSKEPVHIDALTIEHIMPQNEQLSEEWRSELGPEWKRIQGEYLHTIGNLTLTGYNPALGDRSFREKRDMPHGFRQSQVSLSADLRTLDTWNETAIQERGQRLALRAVNIWPYLAISDARLEEYRKRASESGETITADHHFPDGGPVRDVWEALRVRILNIDPSVTEEIFKSYNAYKSSTNFVDINPQKSRLVLTLNIEFDALNDPRGWCRDVSTVGKYGNGDAQFTIVPGQDLDCALDLIHQAFAFRFADDTSLVTA